MTTAAVSGATGFIGRYLCRALSEAGIPIRALGRSHPSIECDFVCWDLTGDLNPEALVGVDTLFHLAGKAHALAETSQDEQEYFAINTEGTRRLLEAAKLAGVRRFVFISSVKAMSDDGSRCQDETDTCRPTTLYGRSKLAAEKLVLEGGYVPQPVVLRPAMVYGDTSKGNLPKMIRAVQHHRFLPLPPLNNLRSMVHVEDLVQATMFAAERPEAAGQIYIVTDGQDYSTRQIYEWICEALHRPVPGWHMPLSVLRILAHIGDLIGTLSGRRFVFDCDALEKLVSSACYSSSKIERELGYTPGHQLRDSLPGIIAHLKNAP